MSITIQQVSHNSKLNLGNTESLNLFKYVYHKHTNFKIDNLFYYPENKNHYEENKIIIKNNNDYILNLFYKIKINNVQIKYKNSSDQYINILLTKNNLNNDFNHNIVNSNIFNYQNILNFKDDIIFFYIHNDSIYIINKFKYYNNFNQLSTLSDNTFFQNNFITNLDDITYFNDKLNNFNDSDIENKINIKNFITNNINLSNNDSLFKKFSLYIGDVGNIILFSLRNIFINNINTSISYSNNVIKKIKLNIKNYLLSNINHEVYYYIFKSNFIEKQLIINKNNFYLNFTIDSIEDYNLFISDNLIVIKQDNILNFFYIESNTNSNLNINLEITSFNNDLNLLQNSEVVIIKDNLNQIVSTTNIININFIDEQYKIILPVNNNLNLSLEDINTLLFLKLDQTNDIKIIFKINEIDNFNDNLILYCFLYNSSIYSFKNLEINTFSKYKQNNYKLINNFNDFKYDSEKTYDNIVNIYDNYINITKNNIYKKLILDSINYSINNNFKIIINIYNNLFNHLNISYCCVDYKLLNNNYSSLNYLSYSFNHSNKNIDLINYFFNIFKKTLKQYSDVKFENNLNNQIIPFIDKLDNNINLYSFNLIKNISENFNTIYNKNKNLYHDIIIKITYVSNLSIQIKLYGDDLNVTNGDTLYLFENNNSNYLTKISLVSKTAIDNKYEYLCDLINDDLSGININYYLSADDTCSTYIIIEDLDSDIFNYNNFNTANYIFTEDINNNDPNKIYINKKSYCLNYYLLIYLIELFNILKQKVYINEDNIEVSYLSYYTKIFNSLFTNYYNIYNLIKEYEYTIDNKNIKLYDNHDFNDFNLNIEDNQVLFYNISNLNNPINNFNITNIIKNLFNMNDLKYFLYNKVIHFNNNLIYLNYDIIDNLDNDNIWIYFNEYINYNIKQQEITYFINNIFYNDLNIYNNFVNNLLDCEKDIGYDSFKIVKYINSNYSLNNDLMVDILNTIYSNINSNSNYNNYNNKSNIINYIDSQNSNNITNFNLFLNNINLLSINFNNFNNKEENYNFSLLNTSISNILINNGDFIDKYSHDDTTIIYNNGNGIIDNIFNKITLTNTYDLTKFKNEINNNINEEFNLLSLLSIIKKSLYTNKNKNNLFIKNNIHNILKYNNIIVNSDLEQSNSNLKDFYKNLKTEIKSNFYKLNNQICLIFDEELFFDTNINSYFITNIDEVINNITTYKLLTINFSSLTLPGSDVLDEIESLKINLVKLYYNYKKNNLSLNENFDVIINNILSSNYTVNGIQKYYFYKNCILTYEEYNSITPKNNYCIIKVKQIDDIGAILDYEILVNSNNYSNNQLVCLSNGIGINAYGNINLGTDNNISTINLINKGKNYIINEELLLDVYEIPDTLEFLDDNFQYIKRKTDLPFEIQYFNQDIFRRHDNKNYILLNEIIYNLVNFRLYDYSKTFNIYNLSGDIISFSQSSNFYWEYDNLTETKTKYYYTLIELDTNLITFVKIENTINYDGIYILYKTETNNIFEIKTKYVINETSKTYTSGLDIIFNDDNFNIYINFLYLDLYFNNNNLNEFKNLIDNDINFNKSKNIKFNNNLNIYDLINDLGFSIIKNINKFNRKIIYSDNFTTNIFPSNHIISNNLELNNITEKNLIEYEKKILRYNLIKDKITNLINNPYNKNDNSNFEFVKNYKFNIFNYTSLYFNDKLIYYIPKEYFYIYNKLFISKHNSDRFFSDKSDVLYINIPIWINKSKKYNIPTFLLNNTDIQIRFKLNDLKNLINFEENTYFVNPNIFNISLLCNVVYHDIKFNYFYNNILFEELQYLKSKNLDNKKLIFKIPIKFIKSVKELIFVLVKNDDIENKIYNNYNIDDTNPIEYCKLLLNNSAYSTVLDSSITNYINYFNKYLNIPEPGINIISFCLDPNNYNPSGTINFNLIKNVELEIKIKENYINNFGNLIVFGTNYNLLKIKDGIGNLIY